MIGIYKEKRCFALISEHISQIFVRDKIVFYTGNGLDSFIMRITGPGGNKYLIETEGE